MLRSSASLKSAGAGSSLPDNFPEGLRVLVVDDDPTCLMIIERMLKKCKYEAIICNKAETCLALLRENKNVCDIVLTDVHMPDIDGFKLLEFIRLEMDIPVIMMSVDDSPSVMRKGVTHGACDYIIKPIRIETLRTIWLHVIRSQKPKCKECQWVALSADDVNQHQKQFIEYVDCTSPGNEAHKEKIAKRGKDKEPEYEEPGESSSSKKARVVWSVELHQKFVAAVHHLGIDRAVPKKILDLMNVPGITRENIASHLQKYRLYLKRLSEAKHPSEPDTSFMDFINRGCERRALTGRGQLHGQPLTPLQTSVLDRLNYSRSSVTMPGIDQRNKFIFEDPRFHGNPTNMEPKQFLSLNPSHQYPFNGVNGQALVPMAGQSQNFFSNVELAQGLGSNVLGSGMGPSYSFLNSPNPIQPNSGPQNMTFTDWMTYPTSPTMGPITSFAGEGSGTRSNNTGDNQHDVINALLDQPIEDVGQQGNELEFDGFPFDDLPRET